MKKKNGFTLVELLAVIVILSIILVIAVPQIMKTIDESREGALSSSAKLIAASAEREYLVRETLGDTEFTSLTEMDCEDVVDLTEDYESCTIQFNDGKATVTLKGAGKFEGKSVCFGTRDEAEVTNGNCYIGDVKYPANLEELSEMIEEQSGNTQLNLILPDDMEIIIDDLNAQQKKLNFVGNGTQTIVFDFDESGGTGYSTDGSIVTFEKVNIVGETENFSGLARTELSFIDCVFTGTLWLYGNAKFVRTTFETSGDNYSVWTWGAANVTFDDCIFNTDGKALCLYGTVNTNLVVNDCVFNDSTNGTTNKAAIETMNDYQKSYTLTANNNVVNGFAINPRGIVTNSTLWANKNSMTPENLSVTIDGVKVY